MHCIVKKIVVIFIALCLVTIPLVGLAETNTAMDKNTEASAGKMAADLLFLRPVGAASTIFGCCVYVVSLPFSIPGGNSKEVLDTVVTQPAKYTFDRAMGDF